MIARGALLVALTTTLAHADGAAPASRDSAPDPAVQDAAEANLETSEPRRGVTFAVSAGGGLIVGFGMESAVGRGGSVSLRLGHVATRRTVITFEIQATAVLNRAEMDEMMMDEPIPNTDANLLTGAQYYVNRSLWLRVAGGVGVYTRRDTKVVDGEETTVDTNFVGPAVLGGVGIELMRLKWASVGLEISTSAMVNRDGVLISNSLGLDLSFD